MKRFIYTLIIVTFVTVYISSVIIYVNAEDSAPTTYSYSDDTTSNSENNNDYYDEIQKNDVSTDIIMPIVIEFIGAFLGIIAALWLNSFTNKKQYKELNSSLHNELLTLEQDLRKRFKENPDYYRYLTPVWDINLASGNLSILANKHIDKKYIEIYTKIQYAQELEREYIHSKLLEKNDEDTSENDKDTYLYSYITSINNARNREANKILDLIVKLKNKEVT